MRPLSEAQEALAYRAYQGDRPKLHKGIYGHKYDNYTCRHCGAGVAVNYNFCYNCGFRLIWDSCRCLTGVGEEAEDDDRPVSGVHEAGAIETDS